MKSMAKVPGKRAHTSCPADANVLFDIKRQSSALSNDIATALPGSDKKVRDFPRVEGTPEESARCSVPECEGIRQTDPAFREALWARYFMAAPRPRTPSELRYSDRRLRSKSLRHSMG